MSRYHCLASSRARRMPSLKETLNNGHGAVLQVHPRTWGTPHVRSSEHFVLSLDNLLWLYAGYHQRVIEARLAACERRETPSIGTYVTR